jgi:hypothetical protein
MRNESQLSLHLHVRIIGKKAFGFKNLDNFQYAAPTTQLFFFGMIPTKNLSECSEKDLYD